MFFIVSSWRHIFGVNIQIEYLRFSDFEVHQEIQSCEAGRGRHGLGAAWRHGARLALSKRLREQLSRSRYAHWGRVLGRSSVSEGTPSHVEGVGAQATPQPCADGNNPYTTLHIHCGCSTVALPLEPRDSMRVPRVGGVRATRKGSGHMYGCISRSRIVCGLHQPAPRTCA